MKETGLKVIGVYAFLLGLLYAGVGMMSLVLGLGHLLFGNIDVLGLKSSLPADALGGSALVVIGAVYLAGVKPMWSGEKEGLSFIFVGFILSAIFGMIFLLIMGAHWLDFWLGETGEFSFTAELRPEVWLFLISLPVGYLLWKWRKTEKH